jgi:glycerophosphoryl diester phosphodiesterase
MKNIQSKPLIIGHRGASAHAPENTLASFRQALTFGADGVELDAKLTSNGEVVVIHDQTVNRTTNGEGVVRELTLAQIKKMDAGAKFDPKFKGEPIPTLEEVFQAVGGKLLINVELTNYSSPSDELPEKVAELVKKYSLQKGVIFSSFHPKTLKRIRKLLPEVPTGVLALSGIAGLISRGWIGRVWAPDLVHPYFSDVNSAFVKRQHRLQRGVNVWTVDDAAIMQAMIRMDVDGIITDDVVTALEIRAKEFVQRKKSI